MLRTSRHTRLGLVAALALAMGPARAVEPSEFPTGSRAEEGELIEAAIDAPSDLNRFEALLKSLPQFTDRNGVVVYVVDGDLPYTRDSLRNMIFAQAVKRFARSRSKLKLRGFERGPSVLIVENDASTGKPIVLNTKRRKLRFAIDRASFAAHGIDPEIARALISGAAGDWQAACDPSRCGLSITHVVTADDLASKSPIDYAKHVDFIWRYDPSHGEEGLAFFPEDWPTRDTVYLGRPFFKLTAEHRARVVRHELGHILGYRHAERSEASPCNKLNTERPGLEVGTPDPISVMHSPYCANLPTVLSPLDKELHAKAYDLKAQGKP